MNRHDLINAFAEKEGISPELADRVVQCFFDTIREQLLQGGRVEVRDFGVFRTKKYTGYSDRNPKTGEVAEVKPKVLPVVKPGKDFIEMSGFTGATPLIGA